MPWLFESLVINFVTSHSDVQQAVFSELSEPFTKIPLLWFTRSNDLGNEMLKELLQKEGWMGSKWKGLLPCISHCTELAEKGLELFWHLHYQGGAWMLHLGNMGRAPRVESSNGAECVRLPWPQALSACTCSSFLLPWEFVLFLFFFSHGFKEIILCVCIKYLVICIQLIQ